jgi:hypothetical protein
MMRSWSTLLLLLLPSAAAAGTNKFGIGVYSEGSGGTSLPVALQLPTAYTLVGDGGQVLLLMQLLFSHNGNTSSCVGGCVPAPTEVAAVKQAYAMGLKPVVRLGQWPRTIRDFSDDAEHRDYTALARAYSQFAAAIPLPPDGSPLGVIALNEPNTGGEWQCSGPGRLSTGQAAPEVAGCLRDILAALRLLPGLRLSVAPTAYTGSATYPCAANAGGRPDPVNWLVPTDIAFMRQMLQAVPDLYAAADFFNSHPYPWGNQPFSTPLGRAGAVHYRTQLNETGRGVTAPPLPVLISEAGWKGADQEANAVSVMAALQQEWLPDPRVVGITPFLLSDTNTSVFAEAGWLWVVWPNTLTVQYNHTRALRCRLGVGGAATC